MTTLDLLKPAVMFGAAGEKRKRHAETDLTH